MSGPLIKGRDSVGAFLKHNASANSAPDFHGATDWDVGGKLNAYAEAEPVSAAADRITELLRKTGPSTPVQIVETLHLGVGETLAALERLERFGFVAVDRDEGAISVSIAD